MNLMSKQQGFLSPILLVIIVVILLVLGAFLFIFNKSNPITLPVANSNATISGTIDLNGTPPSGSTIAIAEKLDGDTDFKIVTQNINAVDGVKWSWIDAKKNTNYQIQAYLQQNGQNIALSEIRSVTAPASSESLRINVTTSSVQTDVNATISGSFDINGYIPTGATVNIFARKIGDPNYQAVVTGLPSVDGSGWNWSNAISNTGYEIKGVLVKNGTSIAESSPLVVTAPAANEVLRIVSNAQAPATVTSASLSGVIDLNGTVAPGSSIVIVARKAGTSKYNVVSSGIPAKDQASWFWNGALPGVQYNVQAVLKANNQDQAVSNTLTVFAPAANEVLTLNSGYQKPQLPSPSQGPFISCAGQSNNLWSVNVTFNYVQTGGQNAAQYWVRVGDPSSDNRYLDQRVTAQNQPGQTQQSVSTGYVIGNGGTYYAKYTYSPNNSSGNLNDFSAWSGAIGFTCGAPTPSPTNTPTPFPTLLPTDTPTPTPTVPPAPTNLPQ